jgi:hypothetical protein
VWLVLISAGVLSIRKVRGHAQHVVIEDWRLGTPAAAAVRERDSSAFFCWTVVCSQAHRAEKKLQESCKVHGVRNATPVLSGSQLKVGVLFPSSLEQSRQRTSTDVPLLDPVPVRRSALACDQHGDRDFVPGRPGQGTRIVSITHPARQLRHFSEHAVEVCSLWPVEDRPLPAGNPDLPRSRET